VPSCRSHLQSPFCVALACYVGKVLTRIESPFILGHRLSGRDPHTVPEKLHSLPEAAYSIDLNAADGRCLGRVALRDQQTR
jgi:hypothetical protein